MNLPQIEKKPVSELKPAPYNPRIHGEAFMRRLRHSMDMFGYVEPIVWNKRTGHVVGGHARLKVMVEEGEKEIDVVVVDIGAEQEKALNIALNHVTGEFDNDALVNLLDELATKGIDLEDAGFDELALEELRATVADSLEHLKQSPTGDTVYQYTLVFNTEEEQQAWEAYVKWARAHYMGDTISEVIVTDIRGRGILDG